MRHPKLIIAALGAFFVTLPLLMAPTGGGVQGGGFPARPRFNSVGVGTVPPTFGISVATGAAQSALTEYAGNGNVIGTSSVAVGQDASGDGAILQRRNAQLYIGTNGSVRLAISGTGATTLNTFPLNGMIVCTTACDVSAIKVGQMAAIYSTGGATVSNSTVTVADTKMQFTGTPFGDYALQFDTNWSANAAAGAKYTWAATSSTSGLALQLCSATLTGGQPATGAGCTAANLWINGTFAIHQTGSDTIKLFWAQNVANAAATTNNGGWAILTRIN